MLFAAARGRGKSSTTTQNHPADMLSSTRTFERTGTRTTDPCVHRSLGAWAWTQGCPRPKNKRIKKNDWDQTKRTEDPQKDVSSRNKRNKWKGSKTNGYQKKWVPIAKERGIFDFGMFFLSDVIRFFCAGWYLQGLGHLPVPIGISYLLTIHGSC